MNKSLRHIYHIDARPKKICINANHPIYVFYISKIFLTNRECVNKLIKYYSTKSKDVLIVTDTTIRDMIKNSQIDDILLEYLSSDTKKFFEELKHILEPLKYRITFSVITGSGNE